MPDFMTLDFKTLQAVIMDMDGVLWRGDEPLPYVREFIHFVQAQGLPVALATNNSSRHPSHFISKLAKFDIHTVPQDAIVTSGTATADYLHQQFGDDVRVYLIGMDGLAQVLTEAGIEVMRSASPDDAERLSAVVVGIDFDFNYEKARLATLLIRAGVPFIGTNPDTSFPAPEGLLPGAGSLVQMIAAASDTEPVIIGKPARAMFEMALQRMGTPEGVPNFAHTLMIGDRLNTDIEGALALGMPTALVMTGVTNPEVLRKSPIIPTQVFTDLGDLLGRWREA
jgi:4-nitrophenyl phosphatase